MRSGGKVPVPNALSINGLGFSGRPFPAWAWTDDVGGVHVVNVGAMRLTDIAPVLVESDAEFTFVYDFATSSFIEQRDGEFVGTVALTDRVSSGERVAVHRRNCPESVSFVGYRFPPEVILLAVRWYLRYGLSYRDVEELLAERGIEVDHVTIYRWVQRFTPLLIDAARPCRHVVGDWWFADETYVKVAGVWRYVYRAVDQHGQVIDVYVSKRRDIAAATTFFEAALAVHGRPAEVTTDLAAPLLRVIDELIPDAFHDTEQYSNNRIENDHGRLKARLRPMRGLRTDRTASIMISGHAFIQNLRRGHYELGVEVRHDHLRLAAAFDELARAI